MPEQPPDQTPREPRRRAPRQQRPDVPEVAALAYDQGVDHAPKMVARGSGLVAKRIMEIADEHKIPVKRDPMLISILGALDVGAEIPPDLYGVIAEVLAWAYRADQAAGSSSQRRAA